jgi:hypothetical protein
MLTIQTRSVIANTSGHLSGYTGCPIWTFRQLSLPVPPPLVAKFQRAAINSLYRKASLARAQAVRHSSEVCGVVRSPTAIVNRPYTTLLRMNTPPTPGVAPRQTAAQRTKKGKEAAQASTASAAITSEQPPDALPPATEGKCEQGKGDGAHGRVVQVETSGLSAAVRLTGSAEMPKKGRAKKGPASIRTGIAAATPPQQGSVPPQDAGAMAALAFAIRAAASTNGQAVAGHRSHVKKEESSSAMAGPADTIPLVAAAEAATCVAVPAGGEAVGPATPKGVGKGRRRQRESKASITQGGDSQADAPDLKAEEPGGVAAEEQVCPSAWHGELCLSTMMA